MHAPRQKFCGMLIRSMQHQSRDGIEIGEYWWILLLCLCIFVRACARVFVCVCIVNRAYILVILLLGACVSASIAILSRTGCICIDIYSGCVQTLRIVVYVCVFSNLKYFYREVITQQILLKAKFTMIMRNLENCNVVIHAQFLRAQIFVRRLSFAYCQISGRRVRDNW